MSRWMYELKVAGSVSDDVIAQVRAELGPVFLTTQSAGTSIIATVPDQSALLGILDELHGLGLSVRGLRRMPESTPAPHGSAMWL